MNVRGFPGQSVVKNLPANAEDMGSIPGSGRSPGEENGNRLQYSCLENSMDRGGWQATVPKAKSQTGTKQQQQHVEACMFVCLGVISMCLYYVCT